MIGGRLPDAPLTGAVARSDADGTPDPDFGDDGVAIVDLDGGEEYLTSIALQSDGKVLLGGVSILGPAVRAVIVRLTADGVLDPSFGTGGAAILPIAPPDPWRPVSVAVAPDGGVIAAVATRGPQTIDFGVVRLLGDSVSICGNGLLEPGELCHDGNLASGDGCAAGCFIETCFRCTGEPSECVERIPRIRRASRSRPARRATTPATSMATATCAPTPATAARTSRRRSTSTRTATASATRAISARSISIPRTRI